MKNKFIVVSDVDGCLTDGGFYYTSEGKVMKRFGAGDHEGVKLLKKNNIDVLFITADKAGLPIVQKRMKDMSNSDLKVMSEVERFEYIKSLKDEYDVVVFFGDGLGDAYVAENDGCNYFVCPKQSRPEVIDIADYVTEYEGGHGAFLDMAIWVAQTLQEENYQNLYE